MSRRKKQEDPIVIDIRDRLGKVETRLAVVETKLEGVDKRFDIIDKKFEDVFDRIKTLDNRLWWLLGGIIISILLTLIQFAK